MTKNRRKIFVFSSDLLGIHRAGAAKGAVENYGAIYGQGEGLQGDSYAIPTKHHPRKNLPLHNIESYVKRFLKFAENNTDMIFIITRLGCGLAGYKDHNIAPMFFGAPSNCTLPRRWRILRNEYLRTR